MDFSKLKLDIQDGVATITLNRPEVYNAFDDALSYELQDALKAVKKDPEAKVLVLTGCGKAFSSGQDLKSVVGKEKRSFKESLHKRYNPIIKAVREMPKPVICKLNGVAAGAGCSLALACDIIVAAETATLIEVFVNIGLVLDSGSSYFLPRLMSYTRAFELSTMGKKLPAIKAYEWGIVNEVVLADQLDEAVARYTDYYVTAPTQSIALMKKMLQKSCTSTLDEMLEYEAYCQQIAGSSEYYKKSVEAFVSKKKDKPKLPALDEA